MTRAEWNDRWAALSALWPHAAMSAATREASFFAVEPLDAADVDAAIRGYYRQGHDFPPSAAQLANLIEEHLNPTLPFDEAWESIYLHMGHRRPGEHPNVVLRGVERDCGPAVAGWLRMYGVEALAGEPVDDPVNGGVVKHRIKQSYDQAMKDPAVRRRMEERAIGGPRSGEIRRFNPEILLDGPAGMIGPPEDEDT
jgi:hypothetical protein